MRVLRLVLKRHSVLSSVLSGVSWFSSGKRMGGEARIMGGGDLGRES